MNDEEMKKENDALKAHIQLLETIINADPIRLMALHLRSIDGNLGYLVGVILEDMENQKGEPAQRNPPPVT